MTQSGEFCWFDCRFMQRSPESCHWWWLSLSCPAVKAGFLQQLCLEGFNIKVFYTKFWLRLSVSCGWTAKTVFTDALPIFGLMTMTWTECKQVYKVCMNVCVYLCVCLEARIKTMFSFSPLVVETGIQWEQVVRWSLFNLHQHTHSQAPAFSVSRPCWPSLL